MTDCLPLAWANPANNATAAQGKYKAVSTHVDDDVAHTQVMLAEDTIPHTCELRSRVGIAVMMLAGHVESVKQRSCALKPIYFFMKAETSR